MADSDLEELGPIDPVNGTLWADALGVLHRVTTSEDSTPIVDPNRRQEKHENVVPGEEVYTAPPHQEAETTKRVPDEGPVSYTHLTLPTILRV